MSWILLGGSLLIAASVLVAKPTFAQSYAPVPVPAGPLLLDSFADDAPSGFGSWSLSTDRVMGGISDGGASIESVAGRRAMRMTGSVRLENNGGFVQNSLRFRGELDASAYEGIFLGARAIEPGAYYLFVRTSNTYMPWSYYSAPLEIGEGWSELVVPWEAFEAQSTRSALDNSRIRSISVVAYGKAMTADIAVDRIGLYAEMPEPEFGKPSPRPAAEGAQPR